jgi:uncharacterized protein YkwD
VTQNVASLPARTARRWVAATAVASVLAGAPILAPPARAEVSSVEAEFHTLVNAVREAHGLGALNLKGRLNRLAGKHSRQMANQGRLFHSDLRRVLSSSGRSAGENVAMAYSLEQALDAFMGSAAHRDNILGKWNRTGVGVAVHGDQYWVTQIFSR